MKTFYQLLTESDNTRYRFEYLPNGYIRCDDRSTGLVATFEPDGKVRSGYPSKEMMFAFKRYIVSIQPEKEPEMKQRYKAINPYDKRLGPSVN